MTAGDPEPRAFPFLPLERLEIEPVLESLRRDEPVSRVRLPYGGDAWLVTRYKDVKKVLADPRFSRAAVINKDVPRRQEMMVGPEGIMYMDPPEHTRVRRIVSKVFTAQRVEEMRPWVQQVADELLDRMEEHGPPADLVEFLSLPLPTTLICQLLGVPYEDRERFKESADALLASSNFESAEYLRHIQWISRYFVELIAKRRKEPTEDMIGTLIRAHDDEERLTEGELVSFAMVLLLGGHETSAAEITNSVYTLAHHPDAYARLRAEPELVPTAVEELLRYIPLGSGHHVAVIATEDAQLDGMLIEKGEAVFVHFTSANKDSEQFENPEALDLSREPNPHLTFGHGAHHCIASQFARMELQVALGSLVRRFPRISLAIDEDDIPWRTSQILRGPTALPIQW